MMNAKNKKLMYHTGIFFTHFPMVSAGLPAFQLGDLAF